MNNAANGRTRSIRASQRYKTLQVFEAECCGVVVTLHEIKRLAIACSRGTLFFKYKFQLH
jgi:hypothetical protein